MSFNAPLACLLFSTLLAMVSAIQEEDLKHECLRECILGEAPKVCKYNFTVEWYYTMSKACYNCPENVADCDRPHCVPINGVKRPVIAVNRMIPGPSIQVCEGDTIDVTVMNQLGNGEGISVHWHGLYQKGTPFMDGVSHITQCPTQSATSFTYFYEAKPSGTHYWHAHTGVQRADGFAGTLIVRQPKSMDPSRNEYDCDLPEHVVIIQDWMDQLTINKFLAFHHAGPGGGPDDRPESIIINGKGKRKASGGQAPTDTPREVFLLNNTNCQRYRFRVISNAVTDCTLSVSVDSHKLTMIASDGRSFEPIVVDAVIINAGERYDFVLNADKAVGNYWMRVKGLADCGEDGPYPAIEELAIVRYGDAQIVDPSGNETSDGTGVTFNPLNENESETGIPVSSARSLENEISLDPDQEVTTHYITIDYRNVTNSHYNHETFYPGPDKRLFSSQINNISFTFQAVNLLTQNEELPSTALCYDDDVINKNNCGNEYCECTQVYKVGLNKVVELVIINEGIPFSGSHPMHLHGFSFHLVAMNKLGDSTTKDAVMALDRDGNITRNLVAPPIKDTVAVPDGGYTIVRFVADNPGWWFFHCHDMYHLGIGMSMVFQVGENSDLPPTPNNFPRCYDWASATTESATTKSATTKSPSSHAAQLIAPGINIVFAVLVFACYLKIIDRPT